MAKKNTFRAEWSGKSPRPYIGDWKLYKNNEDITFMMPTDLRTLPAFTYGEYPVWEEYAYAEFAYVPQFVTDGYRVPEWIQENRTWLDLIVDDDMDYLYLYEAFHKNDFRTSNYI